MYQGNPLHMKNQALFSAKNKSKKLKCCLLQFLFGALRVKAISRKAKLSKIISNCRRQCSLADLQMRL